MAWINDYTTWKQYNAEYNAYENKYKNFKRGQIIRILKNKISNLEIEINENEKTYIQHFDNELNNKLNTNYKKDDDGK